MLFHERGNVKHTCVASLGSLDIHDGHHGTRASSLLLSVQEYAIVVVHCPGPRCLTMNVKLPQVRNTFSGTEKEGKGMGEGKKNRNHRMSLELPEGVFFVAPNDYFVDSRCGN